MKTFLWFAAAVGALAAAAAVVDAVVRSANKPQLRNQLALAGGVDYEIFEAEIIEIEPLDTTGPQMIDDTTLDLLQELEHEGLFSKKNV